jgi:hypothetical protein
MSKVIRKGKKSKKKKEKEREREPERAIEILNNKGN